MNIAERQAKEAKYDESLENIMKDIVIMEKTYMRDYGWMSSKQRIDLNTKIHRLSQHYNDIVSKRAAKAEPNKIKSLYVPGQQPEHEKLQLMALIDSI